MVSMVYQLCSPASARTKQEAGRLLCGARRVKVGSEFAPRGADDKSPILSRLDLALGLCFVGVARDSNRGVSIRNAPANGFVTRCRGPTRKIAKYLRLEICKHLKSLPLSSNSNSRFAIRKQPGGTQVCWRADGSACPRLRRVSPFRFISQLHAAKNSPDSC
jgi:hypothetical protein